MKSIASIAIAALPLFVQQAMASLNCTLVSATATERYCEWDGCQAYATATPGAILHAGCRADCSTNEDSWFQLYDGAFVRTENLEGCNYHGAAFPITGKNEYPQPCSSTAPSVIHWLTASGLPHCYEEKQLPAPTNCPESSASGLASKIPAPVTLGPEPPAFTLPPSPTGPPPQTKMPRRMAY
ncbi:uncharacterized protein BP5553_01082 [Venustampulla echinocandica]|uniref:Secreted protein n=1 Tax=Venustampulla echinocandica TaxID=2656787 RepID=A0A370U015_9HELO|nr:uncharacterized protein BP5553_01082 [Venustampulla echinocandica]RDL41103.1 hypothetical protein BP5553_01082 [Venustampulla echinocandica]